MRTIRRRLRNPFCKRILFLAGMLTLILLFVFIVSALATAARARAAQPGTQTTYESVYITAGDSLWSIARKYRGGRSTAAFVETLKELNGLSSDRIRAGSYILVPVTSVRPPVYPGAVQRVRPCGGARQPVRHSGAASC